MKLIRRRIMKKVLAIILISKYERGVNAK